MPVELAGLSNENEFYSEHYLTTIFEGDIEETLRAWREADKAGQPSPARLLDKAGSLWRRLSAEYRDQRDDRKRLAVARTFTHDFLTALGYERRVELLHDAEGKLIPVLARRLGPDGQDIVWVVETPSPAGADFETDPLQLRFRCEQFDAVEAAADVEHRRKDAAETALTRGIFALDAPPRFVVLLSMSQAVLIDRRKWADSRLLRFRFGEIFGRADHGPVSVMAALLNADSLAPGSGTALVDRIDEESHRHAYGVSQDLKFALREAIELLGNEAAELIVAKRRESGKGVFSGGQALDAERLTTECLRYMYRLLFLFFIEARPELGFAPMRAQAYRTGYSLEGLRELELVPLETDEDRGGHYISDTLDTLFAIVFEGTPGAGVAGDEAFTFHPVRARLFSPEATGTYLRGLRFRNSTMQRIIELLSLSKGDRTRGRGRISYAQLGISQLGAVYESLLSFSGFFATEDLIELKPAGKPAPGPLEAAFFAPRRRGDEFKRDEIVYVGTEAKVYPKGAFIYRLAGRNRENSASYYTPEPLARVLVKYALKDLLAGKKADDILKLRIIEPAMGSAAFLVEVVNQLADKYLDLKQAELKRRIPHERYALERQKVRAFLADRNVFGVDLNPVAVELGQVSLWLNCLHEGGFAPWFEDQVHAGNSLVGARRAVFPTSSLGARQENDRWHRRKPRELGWSGERRAIDEVWHFLLPDPGMSAYDQNIVRPLAPEAWTAFAEWRREFVRPLDKDEIATVTRLSGVIDQLFEDVAERLQEVRREVNDDIAIWPAELTPGERHIDFQEKIRRMAAFHGKGVRNSVSWRRLKAVMDAWCALWFWPVDKAGLLPSRTKFFQDLDLVLTQGVAGREEAKGAFATGPAQGALFQTLTVPAEKGPGLLFRTEERDPDLQRHDLFGDVDVDSLVAASPWLPVAMEIAAQQRFMHFDLEFADVMRERGGFDLIVGNPPWLKPMWRDDAALAQHFPELHIRGLNAAATEELKQGNKESILLTDYLQQHAVLAGLQSFMASASNLTITEGAANLYQGFLNLSFRISSENGMTALIHQDTHLTEGRNRAMRDECLSRIRYHFSFRNEITGKLFAEVNHTETFSLNIYGKSAPTPKFKHLSGLFTPSMVDACFDHDGVGEIPAIKRNGNWDTRGHRKRIVEVDLHVLDDLEKFTTEDASQGEAGRFAYIHSQETLHLVRALRSQTKIGQAIRGLYLASPMWGEADVTKRKKIMTLQSSFVEPGNAVVIKSPCIYTGNPLYKCPERICSAKEHFEEIDLAQVDKDYSPRTVFQPLISSRDLYDLSPSVPWSNAKHHDHFRVAYRRMVQPARERTLAAALIPPGWHHVETVMSMSFEREDDLLRVLPLLMSLPLDFVVKTLQIQDIRDHAVRRLPWAAVSDIAVHRALKLNALTAAYASLWNRHASELATCDWSKADPRLCRRRALDCSSWSPTTPFRTDFERRMALIEVDVLVSMALGLTCDHLLEMYRTQFPVLIDNEQYTWHDQKGQIVWTSARGLTGVGWRKQDGKKPTLREWLESYSGLPAGEILTCDVQIDFIPNGPVNVRREFEAPFTLSDREADYRQAWAFFEARAEKKAA